MQTVDAQNIVASNINHIIICWFSEATHTFSHQRPTWFSHYVNVGLGAAQDCVSPLQQAAERTALLFSQGPIDGCCSVSEEQHSVKGLGRAVRHYSHKWGLTRRVTAAKISWLEPIKACLTFVFYEQNDPHLILPHCWSFLWMWSVCTIGPVNLMLDFYHEKMSLLFFKEEVRLQSRNLNVASTPNW